MLKIKVNDTKEYQVNFNNNQNNEGSIDGEDFKLDLIKLKDGSFHLIKDNKSYTVELVRADYQDKSFVIAVNGVSHKIHLKDKFDLLLKDMGFESLSSVKIQEVKAPMPGLVLDILVKVGDVVKKGDPLMILEAMKMENILKSTADGIVKKINVEKKQAVEKGQVLINF
jgi:biotin carboxyl carrier protein